MAGERIVGELPALDRDDRLSISLAIDELSSSVSVLSERICGLERKLSPLLTIAPEYLEKIRDSSSSKAIDDIFDIRHRVNGLTTVIEYIIDRL